MFAARHDLVEITYQYARKSGNGTSGMSLDGSEHTAPLVASSEDYSSRGSLGQHVMKVIS